MDIPSSQTHSHPHEHVNVGLTINDGGHQGLEKHPESPELLDGALSAKSGKSFVCAVHRHENI